MKVLGEVHRRWGDGGVSTLPSLMDPDQLDFYRALRKTALWEED